MPDPLAGDAAEVASSGPEQNDEAPTAGSGAQSDAEPGQGAEPGTQGDLECATTGACTGYPAGLIHHYSFMDTGTVAIDSVGDANATVVGGELDGSGGLELSSEISDRYLSLPAGLLSGLPAATVEMWVTWAGGASEQRLMSLGTATPRPVTRTAVPNCGRTPEYHGGSWYLVCDEATPWETARAHCEQVGGRLADLEGPTEEQFVLARVGLGAWFGASDQAKEGEWTWATPAGSDAGGVFWRASDPVGSAAAGTYVNWRFLQPDNAGPAGEDCAYISGSDGTWNDNPCTEVWPFACEWRGHRGTATDSGMWLTPAGASGGSELWWRTGGTATHVAGPGFAAGQITHVVAVLDPVDGQLSLFIDGVLVGQQSASQSLSVLRDVDAWVGRSHVVSHPHWGGDVWELRIYNRPLSASEVALNYEGGHD